MCARSGLSDQEDWLKLNDRDAKKIPAADKPAPPAQKDLDPIAEPHMDPGADPDAPAPPKDPNVDIIPNPPAKVSNPLASFASLGRTEVSSQSDYPGRKKITCRVFFLFFPRMRLLDGC